MARKPRFDQATATDAFESGTPRAFDALGPHDTVHCCNCASVIKHVYLTEHGPMGGDCLATITGNDATRKVIRSLAAKLHHADLFGANRISVEERNHGAATAVCIVRPAYFDEYAGRQVYRPTATLAVVALPIKLVRDMVADAGLPVV